MTPDRRDRRQAAPATSSRTAPTPSFMADVIEASRDQPVIVDFWATWCGPCRQLGPALEKAVTAAKGAVKLVKIDIDKNPAFAGQLRVQSIPTVYAFVDGQPVDGFMGARAGEPGQGLRRQAGQGRPAAARTSTSCWPWRKESLELGDIGGAAQAYRPGAAGRAGEPEGHRRPGPLLSGRRRHRARRARSSPWPRPDAKDADLDSVRAALALAAEAPVRDRRVRAAAGRRSRTTTRRGSSWPRPWPASGQLRGGGRPAADHHRDATATGTTRRRASSC